MIGLWHILAVALGGAVGALIRFGVAQGLNPRFESFPVATLLVNVVGCLGIGFCFILFHEKHNPALSDHLVLRDGVRYGLLGALTTFSTYSMESIQLLQRQQYLSAALNLIGSVVLGLAAAGLGLWIGQRTVGV
ncbi:MAG: fluoride efflux transporter CrcB [Phycisphaeraceae bacterium]|nr:fluoride efflux transporter CrcB [Phycisphaeraceae bacterium]